MLKLIFLIILPLLPATASASFCSNLLLVRLIDESFAPPDSAAFLKAAASISPTNIGLDFTFSSSYEARLLALPAEDMDWLSRGILYAAHCERTKIFKAKTSAHVESWHGSAIHIEGYHLIAGFKTATERDNAYAKIPKDLLSYLIPEQEKPFKGRIAGNEHAIIFPSLSWFERLHDVLRQRPYEPVSPRWLRTQADRTERTEANPNGIIYYFKGREPIGFVKNGKAYRFTKKPALRYATVASHHEILKAQRADFNVPLDPLEQFVFGRRLIDEQLAALDVATKLARHEVERLNVEGVDDDARLAIELNSPPKRHQTSITGPLAYAGKRRLDRLRQKLDMLAEGDKEKFRLLNEVSYEIARLKSGEPNSTRYVRFVSVTEPGRLSWEMAYHEFIPENSGSRPVTLLHDQLLRLVYGSHLVERYLTNASGKNPLLAYLRGGVIKIDYDEEGGARNAKIIQTTMSLPVHNPSESKPIEMSEPQIKSFEDALNKALKRAH